MRRLSMLFVLLGVIASMAVAGCGNSHSGSGTEAAAAGGAGTATTGKASGKPILIGELTPLTGQGLNYPTWLAGAQAAARAINAKGGVNGRPVQIVECDDQNNPNQAATCAREMVSKGVVAVAGGASLFGTAIAPILNDNKIAWVGNYPDSAPEFNLPNMMLLDKGPLDTGASAAGARARAGAKKVFLAIMDIPQSNPLVNLFKQAAGPAGLKIVGETRIPLTATDLSANVQQAANSGANSVMLFAVDQLQVNFMKTAKQLGLNVIFGANDGANTTSDWVTAAPSSAVVGGGTPPVTAYKSYPDKYPGLADFLPNMQAEFKAGNKYADPTQAGYYTMHSWLAVKVIAQLAEHLKEINAPSVMNAFNTAKDIKTGVIPPWTPSANNGPPGYSRVSNPLSWASKINSDGMPELIQAEPFNGVKLLEGAK
jgi:ABC-type branched-subunit amino acid transport system substrate-binding protein